MQRLARLSAWHQSTFVMCRKDEAIGWNYSELYRGMVSSAESTD